MQECTIKKEKKLLQEIFYEPSMTQRKSFNLPMASLHSGHVPLSFGPPQSPMQ